MKENVNEFIKLYVEEIRCEADNIRHEELQELTEDLFALYEQTGNRTTYENVYLQHRKHLAVFGMLSILYGESKDIKKLEETICCICEEECWALPAHVNRNKMQWRRTVDLFASETAQALAEITFVCKDKLSAGIVRLARDNIEYRVLKPFYESECPYSFWEKGSNNWNAVCCGAIGSASIYLYGDDPKYLDQKISRILDSLSYYIESFPNDGVCLEGLSYFTYGMTYYAGFAEQFLKYTKGKIDLMESAKMEHISRFQQALYLNGGRTVSFSDSSSHEKFRMGLTSYLAHRFSSVRIPNLKNAARFDSDFNFRWMGIYRDYIWTKKYCKEEYINQDKEQSQYYFENAQWYIANGNHNVSFAVKGGIMQSLIIIMILQVLYMQWEMKYF